ncbi:Ketosteroid isomerase homolog [Pseudarcicella hirudinis]|uniref:Ketosteroid isomerase homolog n=1 Tax=Pseudarcicella hirudinis TaxID=1079859 RepID=A0A1I5XK15_9BACT|nr:nuclear transport factor 2 family protein [Pseudarcicella hirudinis]SFQ32305.1 Ketosteroid isomerase homolog [Pseudarcicella hirudinis]
MTHLPISNIKLHFRFLLVLSFSLFSFGISAQSNAREGIRQMVAAELEFAQFSAEKGTKNAFVNFLSDDAVDYEKGQPRNTKTFWQNRDFKGVLTWQPYFAEISDSGDLGYTVGNWQYHPSASSDKPTAFGTFSTFWKKQSNGAWKVVFDLGSTHTKPLDPYPGTITEAFSSFSSPLPKNQGIAERFVFMADHYYSKNAKTAVNPYEPHLSKNARLLYNGQVSVYGIKEATDFLSKKADKSLVFTGMKTTLASSGDLACVQGIVQTKGKYGSYFRIWKQESKGSWKIVLEVVNI